MVKILKHDKDVNVKTSRREDVKTVRVKLRLFHFGANYIALRPNEDTPL